MNPAADEARERLAALARQSGLSVPAESLDALCRFLFAMLEAGRRLNLTAIRDPDEALVLHALDSLQVAALGLPVPALVLDLGSGNGFPGVAAACLWPAARTVLVERRARKAAALRACLAAAGLARVGVLARDAGQLPALEPELVGAADLVVTRAAGTLHAMTKAARPLLAPGGRVLHWKGPAIPAEERARARAFAARHRLEELPDHRYVLPPPEPGAAPRRRSIAGFRRAVLNGPSARAT